MVKHPVIYEDDTVTIMLEVTEDFNFFHCYVHKWTASSYKHHKKVWKAFLNSYKRRSEKPLLAAVLPDDKKIQKFAKMFGFTDVEGYAVADDGSIRQLMTIGDNDV